MKSILLLIVLLLSTSVLHHASDTYCDYKQSLHRYWNDSCLFRNVFMRPGENHFPAHRCERWACEDGYILVTGCPKQSDYNEWGPLDTDPERFKKWPYCC